MPPLTTRAIQPHRILGQNYHVAQFFQKYGPCVTASHCCALPLNSWGLRHPPTLQASPSLHAVLSMSMRNTTSGPPPTPLPPVPDPYRSQTRQVSITLIKEKCHSFLKDADGVKFHIMTSGKNMDNLKQRSVNLDDYYVGGFGISAPDPSTVSIIAGESGGGKTVEAIVSVCRGCDTNNCLRFYCLASDIFVGQSTLAGLKSAMQKCRDNKGRDYDFLAEIIAATKDGTKCTLGIVVDEAGAYFQVVRALCSMGNTLGEKLGLPSNVTVQVVVAGTGVDGGPQPPGSLPTPYRLTILSSTHKYWKSISKGVCEEVTKSIDAEPRAALMTKNPRFARLLLQQLNNAPTSVRVFKGMPKESKEVGVSKEEPKEESAHNNSTEAVIFSGTTATYFVNVWLLQAAAEFKRLNRVHQKDILSLLGAALSVVLFGNSPDGHTPQRDDDTRRFITDYGMVVDNATWVKPGSAAKQDEWAPDEGETASLVSGKGQRYSLSLAHSSILMLLLGLVPRQSSLSGEALESCVAVLFPLLIVAFRSQTVGDMLKALQIECVSEATIPMSMVVRIKQYQAQGEDSAFVLPDSEETFKISDFDPNDTYVVTNGPKYPFADIVVLIPKTAMILIQCKDYGSDLHVGMVKEELTKMCHPSYLPIEEEEPKKKKKEFKSKKKREEYEAKEKLHEKRQQQKKLKQETLQKEKLKAIDELKKHFGITEVVYTFVGSNAKVMKKAEEDYLKYLQKNAEEKNAPKNDASHIVCFGGLSGVEEPLKSIIAFDDTKPSEGLSQEVGAVDGF